MSAGADQQGRRQEVLARQGRQQQASSRTDQTAGDNFCFLGNTNWKLLEMEFILPPYTYLGSW